MIFTGHYEHDIDAKGRLAIPAKLRGELQRASQTVEGEALSVYVTLGENGSLCIYTRGGFEKLAAELEHSALPAEELLAYEEMLFALARNCELDSQGRIQLPADLVARAALPTEVVVVGAKDHLKIHPRAAWKARVEQLLSTKPALLMNPRRAIKG